MRFIVKSAALLIFINICCGILVPILMSVINNAIASNDVQDIIGSGGVQSFAAWLVTVALMCRIIWDDGKKNTAYRIYDEFFAGLCFAAMFFVYFAPVVFMDDERENARILLSHYYTTCDWLRSDKIGYTTAAAGAAILAVLLIAAVYIVSHCIYVRKHPDI